MVTGSDREGAQVRSVMRRNGPQVAGGVLVLFSFAWLGTGLVHVWSRPVVGWLPLPVLTLLAAHACLRAARGPGLDAPVRRFWRHLGVASVLFTVGVVANARDAVGGAQPSQRLGAVTMACYLAVLVIVLWALLRLPAWHRSRSAWTRFVLDTCIVLITSGVFVWHFSLRKHGQWMAQTDSAAAVLSICMLSFVSLVTFVKVAFAGAGRLDRRAVHVLAAGTAISAAFGSLTPFLADRPYLSSSFAAVSVAAYTIQLAAVRQRQGGGAGPVHRSRWVGLLPYVAVAANDTLLLVSDTGDRTETMIMQAGAVALTVLVVVRQIVALRDNRRLLATVDAHLTRMREYRDRLEHQATHDALTGVVNRGRFEVEVSGELASGRPFHVALLDLDDFKSVNDRLGHGAGDVLITTISRRLCAALRDGDVLARLGGDEFVLLLRRSDDADVTAVLTRLLAAVRRPIELLGHEVVVRVSIGVTHSTPDDCPGDCPQELLRRADVAMYAAKGAGGNRWTWFDPVMDRLAEADARLGADLRHAVDRGELFLLYQPIVELPGGRTAGVEALLRWQHPEHGLISPDVFVPLAERNGHIVELGRWVLEQACRQAAAWQAAHGDRSPGKVSINVSARQLAEPGFVAEVARILDRTGVDRRRIMLEVTETAVLSAGSALDAVREVHELGVLLALDDFGTGSSSLSLLVDCPVDYLKVDKSFVAGATGTAQAVIVQSLIGVTEGLRIQAVAEGVETAAQAERLHAAGYRFAQGFHYARPMTPEAVTEMLSRPPADPPAGTSAPSPTGAGRAAPPGR